MELGLCGQGVEGYTVSGVIAPHPSPEAEVPIYYIILLLSMVLFQSLVARRLVAKFLKGLIWASVHHLVTGPGPRVKCLTPPGPTRLKMSVDV